MAKKKPRDAGEEFIQGILDKIPEEKRDEAKALFSSDEVLEYVGNGTLRQEDYSRNQDELAERAKRVKARQDQLDGWWEENSAALKEYPTLKSEVEELRKKLQEGGGQDVDDEAIDKRIKEITEKVVTKEEGVKQIASAVSASESRVLSLISKLQPLQYQHAKAFDEPIDVTSVVEYAVKNKLNDVEAAYHAFYKDKLSEHQEKLEAKKAEELRARIRSEVEAEMRKSQTPYPVRPSEGASTLTGLTNSKDKPSFGTKAALDAYYAGGQS